ncbi:MAG: hypothetical protein ABSH20_11615 [Tepidisphaeraceae bacterium]|jgi:hypothetical protein
MAGLNHFAIAAGMGATLGPRVTVHHGQIGSPELAATVSGLLQRRRAYIEELNPHDNLTKKYEKAVERAYLQVRQGFSSDRVLADPNLNSKFIEACRDFGIDDIAFNLNMVLIGLRKHSKLKAKSKRSLVPDQSRYAVASEIAARMMFYRYGASVDTTLAHPKLVGEFDKLASSITPGYSPFEYRWAALNMRKKGANVKLKARVIDDLHWSRRIHFDAWARVPDDEGVYTLFEQDSCLFIAGSENLHDSIESQQRITIALDSELWCPNPGRLSWQYVSMPDTQSDYRFGVVRSLVGRWKPIFNIPRGEQRKQAA